MQATLGTLLDRLQGFLGKAYFLAGFLPMVVFLTLNALLAAALFPDAAERLQGVARLDAAGNALTWLGLLLLAYVLGLLVWSLNPTIRQCLEGRYLPRSVRRWLTDLQQRELEALLDRRRRLREEVWELRLATRDDGGWREQLKAARMEGRARPPASLSPELEATSRQLQERREHLKEVGFQELKGLFGLLRAELAAKPADQVPELDQLQQDFRALLDFVHRSVEATFAELTSEVWIRFPKNPANVGPTQLANQAEVQREYGLRRYGLDIELYWLRLQKIARADERYFPVLEDAKTQLDFSVTTVALLTLLTVLWIPLSLLFAPTPGLFLLLAAAGPLSIWVFIHVVGQNYRAFAEAVRSAVDLYRFDLLEALHLQLPVDSTAEKKLWTGLMESTVGATEEAQSYQHPPPGNGEGKDEGKGTDEGSNSEGQDEQADAPDGAGR
jgi:hypothetical protein